MMIPSTRSSQGVSTGVTGGGLQAEEHLKEAEIARMQVALRGSWSPETSTRWSASEPANGQCSVTALVVHDLLGGEILKPAIGQAWHFYNRVNGRIFDFTAEQFAILPIYVHEVSSREEALADATQEQYQTLLHTCCEKLRTGAA